MTKWADKLSDDQRTNCPPRPRETLRQYVLRWRRFVDQTAVDNLTKALARREDK